jgi:hypothetical protein
VSRNGNASETGRVHSESGCEKPKVNIPRKITQISCAIDKNSMIVIALSDDGMLWTLNVKKVIWQPIPPLPDRIVDDDEWVDFSRLSEEDQLKILSEWRKKKES